jgi:hypothetical protein
MSDQWCSIGVVMVKKPFFEFLVICCLMKAVNALMA